MKNSFKFLGIIALSLVCFATTIAYAAISGNLTITGTAEATPAEGIYIINVDSQNTVNINDSTHQYSHLPSSTSVISSVSKVNYGEAGRVEYQITVFNNTDLTYCFRDIYYQAPLEGYNGNDLVSKVANSQSISISLIFDDDTLESRKVAPHEKIVFTAVYTIGKDLDADLDLKTLINLQFGVYVEGEEEALESVESKFLRILNTQSTYTHLIDILDNKYDGDPSHDWTTNYIGNVAGSTDEDSLAVEELFGGQLKIMIGDEPRDATVIIKHQDIDWFARTGDDYVATHPDGENYYGKACEMTLYLAIDPLDEPGEYVTVYAIVFTCERNEVTGEKLSEWYKVGDRYEGTAEVVNYEGYWGVGSFKTDSWRSVAATYNHVAPYNFNVDGQEFSFAGYSYEVQAGWKVTDILHIETEALVNAFLDLMTDAKRIIDNKAYAGEGIEEISAVYNKYSYLCLVDGTGVHWFNYNNYFWLMNAMINLVPAITRLHGTVNNALTNMSELS